MDIDIVKIACEIQSFLQFPDKSTVQAQGKITYVMFLLC